MVYLRALIFISFLFLWSWNISLIPYNNNNNNLLFYSATEWKSFSKHFTIQVKHILKQLGAKILGKNCCLERPLENVCVSETAHMSREGVPQPCLFNDKWIWGLTFVCKPVKLINSLSVCGAWWRTKSGPKICSVYMTCFHIASKTTCISERKKNYTACVLYTTTICRIYMLIWPMIDCILC
jgi:hypothetical protein